jgi:hypothetical protein
LKIEDDEDLLAAVIKDWSFVALPISSSVAISNPSMSSSSVEVRGVGGVNEEM